MNFSSSGLAETKLVQSNFISKVYAWMCMALVLTALTSVYVASSPDILKAIVTNKILFYGLMIAELGLVFGISGMINRISAMTATLLFVLYAVLNGVTFSVIFLAFTSSSIGSTFLVTAGTFGVMSIYGYTTKRDLTSMGNMLGMALVGLVIASLVNMFLGSDLLHWVITYLGIAVFVGLTAYDTQKLKEMGAGGFDTSGNMQKGAIIGALALYLDFINLFLMLLNLLGNRRN